MQVIKNNYSKIKEYERICPHCGSLLKYTDDDIVSANAEKWVYCGACARQITIDSPSFCKPPTTYKEYQCENCGNEVQVEDSELTIGEYGCKYWTCPHCSEKNYADEGEILTADNLVYPQHFASFKNGKQIDAKKLNEWAKEAVAALDKNVDYAVHGCGNSLVFAYKSDPESNEVEVVVCDNGYYETFVEIPEEKY